MLSSDSRVESSTVGEDDENIAPLLSQGRECQLRVNVNTEAHDTGWRSDAVEGHRTTSNAP